MRKPDGTRVPCSPQATVLLLGLLCGCRSGEPAAAIGPPLPPSWRAAIGVGSQVRSESLPRVGEAFAMRQAAAIVVADGWRPVAPRLDDAQRNGLSSFVQQGGRLVLFGYAASLVVDLGLEPQRPEAAPFRFGFDSRAERGAAWLGLRVVSGRSPELFVDLQPFAGTGHTFPITGGVPCNVPTCLWTSGEPQRGEVLARLSSVADGVLTDGRAVAVARWTHGAGEVLAIGLQPDLDSDDVTCQRNARALVAHACRWAGRGASPAQIALWRLGGVAEPAAPGAQPPFGDRELPMAPLLAHTGWQTPFAPAGDEDPGPATSIVADVLLPSWRSGADVIDVALVGRSGSLPLPWSTQDPLRRPQSYRGTAPPGRSVASSVGDLAAEAHARGVLLQASLPRFPIEPGGTAAERLAILRFCARELADRRRLGDRALDGLLLRDWVRDTRGHSLLLLQELQPSAPLLLLGEQAPLLAGALRSIDPDDGVVRGLGAGGISAAFRAGFPADLFPFGVLDARARRPRPSLHGDGPGGFATPDWLVTQANDFVRARIDRGATALWRAHDEAVLDDDTVAYVHGLMLEPLRAAVACRLEATGADGARAGLASLLPEPPPGFGAEVAAPAAVHVLQNNWLRLFGSGGSLLWDPQGLARFRPGEAVLLSQGLLRTRLSGGRPDAEELRGGSIDFLANGTAPAGGHRAAVCASVHKSERPPAVLAFDAAPEWPARLDLPLDAGRGYHELDVVLRAVAGNGIVTVAVDGEVLAHVPFAAQRPAVARTVPVHLASAGGRMLQLEVRDGGQVAIDKLVLHRRGDVAAEARMAIPAGCLASVLEHTSSTYHEERAELRTLADLPGFLWRSECVRAARNLQLERTLQFHSHRVLRGAVGGESARALRSPFVLGSTLAGVPDLAVVPLQLSRYDQLSFHDGELVVRGQVEARQQIALGFLLLPPGKALATLPHLRAVFAALDRPTVIELGDTGELAIPNELPIAWTRVLQVVQPTRTPYMVRENGHWLWRGVQDAGDGSDLLRVVHLPGDTVLVRGGSGLLQRTRPGPGALRCVALRDPTPTSVTARVLQPTRFAPPSVVMGQEFSAVSLDGKPWAWHHGRTVFLPDRKGSYTITTARHDGPSSPHVIATRAPLRDCHFEPQQRELVLVVDVDDERPADLAFTAVVSGAPRAVTGGELVPEADVRHADAVTAAAAQQGGTVIRFLPGVVRVHYGQ